MSDWEFKALAFDSNGKPELGPLSAQQAGKVDDYARVLGAAVESSNVSNPIFSNYSVKESISVRGSDPLSAGNIEYGYCKALHGEETAIAAYRSYYGRKNYKNMVLGIVAGEPGNIPTPCGNCRDIMIDELGTNFEIVSGAPEGGIAVVSKISDYLFDDFDEITVEQMIQGIKELQDMLGYLGSDEEDMSFSIYMIGNTEEISPVISNPYETDVHPERNYVAVICGKDDHYLGEFHNMCVYDPIYPLSAAILRAKLCCDPFVKGVIIVSEDLEGRPPHVMYQDRQHLYEFNVYSELLLGKEQDPPVYLITYKDIDITGIWKTSVKKWLPIPFSPYNFGSEAIERLTEYLKKKQAIQ